MAKQPSKSELRKQWNNAGENVVVLHQFPRSRVCPNPSPFPLKLETYLRVAGIEYVVDSTPKGRSPWITINGKDLKDSQLCLEHLSRVMDDKDLDKDLSKTERSVGRGMRAILEDHFYHCLMMERWEYGEMQHVREKVLAPLPMPSFAAALALKRAARVVRRSAFAQGVGRHGMDEVRRMGLQDLKALSDQLGDKTYVLGKENPTEVDCVLFGFTVQLLYTLPEGNVYRKALENRLVNLKEHCQRMKKRYWPDWKQCCYVG